jgi:hypothetical protein
VPLLLGPRRRLASNNRSVCFAPAIYSDLKARSEKAKEALVEHIDALRKRNGAILRDLLDAHERANRFPLEFDRFSLRK